MVPGRIACGPWSPELAASVRGPVGLDLGGETPAEIALEILGELLAAYKQLGAPAQASPAAR